MWKGFEREGLHRLPYREEQLVEEMLDCKLTSGGKWKEIGGNERKFTKLGDIHKSCTKPLTYLRQSGETEARADNLTAAVVAPGHVTEVPGEGFVCSEPRREEPSPAPAHRMAPGAHRPPPQALLTSHRTHAREYCIASPVLERKGRFF